MDEESTTAITSFRYGNDAPTKITGVEDAHRSGMHERVPLHELEQVSFNVGANYAIRLNDRTRSEYTSFHGRPTCACNQRFNGPSKSVRPLRQLCARFMPSNFGKSSSGRLARRPCLPRPGFQRGRSMTTLCMSALKRHYGYWLLPSAERFSQ